MFDVKLHRNPKTGDFGIDKKQTLEDINTFQVYFK